MARFAGQQKLASLGPKPADGFSKQTHESSLEPTAPGNMASGHKMLGVEQNSETFLFSLSCH